MSDPGLFRSISNLGRKILRNIFGIILIEKIELSSVPQESIRSITVQDLNEKDLTIDLRLHFGWPSRLMEKRFPLTPHNEVES